MHEPAYDAHLDREYDAAASVVAVEPYFERYESESARVRGALDCELDLAYGSHPRETLDIFRAPAAGAPLLIFAHGGYWRRLDKRFVSFVAERAVAAGAACATINYPLAPLATLDEIVDATRRAVAWLARHAARANARSERFVVAGHSAGGHLAGMLAATDWEPYGLRRGLVGGVLAVSGLFDLAPLRRTKVRDWMGFDDANVLRNSPQCHAPRGPMPLVVAVGGDESSEFRRQSEDYAAACASAGNDARALVVPARDHFSVLYDFFDARSELSRELDALLER